MKPFSPNHLTLVARAQCPLFDNKLPPDDGGVGSQMLAFIADLEQTLSPAVSRRRCNISLDAYMDFASRSLWFCEAVNVIAHHATQEVVWSQVARAIGAAPSDENGDPLLDAEGKVVRKSSDSAASFVLNMMGRSASLDVTAGDPDLPPPLLPSNIDQQRQLQINNLYRSLLALQPQCDAGDRQAIDTQIKLQDQLSKLQGTHAPKTTVTFTSGMANLNRLTDEELEVIARGGLTLKQGEDGTYSAGDGE